MSGFRAECMVFVDRSVIKICENENVKEVKIKA